MANGPAELLKNVAGELYQTRPVRLAEGAAVLAIGGYFASHYVPPLVKFVRTSMGKAEQPQIEIEEDMHEQITQ